MMADQIKNQNAGEVSSPTPAEKTSAPARKEPTFAEPPKRKEPNFNAGGEDFSGEAMPEKNLPTFKTEQDKPERKEPVFKPKERKLPTFADEVKHHEDDESLEDDFTSDSVSMPFSVEGAEAVAPIVTINAEAEANEGKKRKRNRKAKKEKDKNVIRVTREEKTFQTLGLGEQIDLFVCQNNAVAIYEGKASSCSEAAEGLAQLEKELNEIGYHVDYARGDFKR